MLRPQPAVRVEIKRRTPKRKGVTEVAYRDFQSNRESGQAARGQSLFQIRKFGKRLRDENESVSRSIY